MHFLYVIVSTGVALGRHSASTKEDASLRTQYGVTLAFMIVAFPFCLMQVMSVIHVSGHHAAPH